MPDRYKILRGEQWSSRLAAALPPASTSLVSWMEQRSHLIKQDAYSRVGLLDLNGVGCFLKLYLSKSALQKMGFHLHIARGLRAFDAGCALRGAGLWVPESRACLLVSEGVLLMTEALAGAVDLREVALAAPDDMAIVRYLERAAEALANLHSKGFKHGDCKFSNLLMHRHRVFLVDLERARKIGVNADSRRPWHRKQLADIARFTADAERFGIGSDAFAVFLQRYSGVMGYEANLLSDALRPHLEGIRRRHEQRYAGLQKSSLL
ncbi:MAG: lipopolysaccharide kinase InaA family protein [Pseudomonadota bacterium]